MSVSQGSSISKIKQYSFIIEYVYLAYMCILVIKTFPSTIKLGLYVPLLIDIFLALAYSTVIYMYSGKEKIPTKIELLMRIIYLIVAGKLLIETNNASVHIIITLPTVIMALRYPIKYTIMTAFITTLVVITSQLITATLEVDYILILLSFIWVIGLLVNASMEVERQAQAERLKIESKEKLAVVGQMAAGIAHEVRNPLTTIKGFVQLLYKYNGVKDSDVTKSYLDMIDKEITRVNDLLKEFLQFAKPNKPQLVISDINKAILEISFLLEAHCSNKGINMNFDLTENLPLIECDYNQIKQVIINISFNAIDAMLFSGKKELMIRTSNDPKYICIDIKDTGSGMTDEQVKKIFDPFFTTKDTGSGLGLSVCYSIIENHHGKILVFSQPGQGTKITILLPKAD